MAQWLAEARPDLTFPHQDGEEADIDIAYCPERVLPGQVMIELIRNDRVVGGMNRKSSSVRVSYTKFSLRVNVLSPMRVPQKCVS